LLGLIVISGPFPAFIPAGHWRNALNLAFAITPLLFFMYGYQRRAARSFHVWELPAATAVFGAYAYVWIFATGIALLRLATGRRNWVKTPRVAEQAPRFVSVAPEPAIAGEPELLGQGS
jgi:hypothetical protein